MTPRPLYRHALTPALLPVLLAALVCPLPHALGAQGTAGVSQQGYRQPPRAIAQIIDAEPLPSVTMSPDRSTLLLLRRPGMPPIAEVAAPDLRLAGDRWNPRTNGSSRDVSFTGFRLRPTAAGEAEREIVTPRGARLGSPTWAPGGKHFVFTVTGADRITLWVADVATGRSRQLTNRALNGTAGAPCTWAGSTRLACTFVVANRGAPPAADDTPKGPIIQEAGGRAAPNRTYQDLLASPSDEARFEYYATSQIALVGLDGTVTLLGSPGLYTNVSSSPDGQWLLVQRNKRPFSYVVPRGRFPLVSEIWNLAGKSVRTVQDRPLQEEVPSSFDAVTPGPRSLQWRADAPATLVWVEALDGGDPANKVAKRDRVLSLAAPFTAAPTAHLDVETRVSGMSWGSRDLAIVTEDWSRTRQRRVWAIDPSDPAKAPRPLFAFSSEDRYANPGSFVTTMGPFGRSVLLLSADGASAYLTGAGASEEGDRPFLDRLDLRSAKTTRLWRSAAPHYEEVVAVLDPAASRLITRRESTSEAPNYWLRDLAQGTAPRQLTSFADPAPQFAGVTKQLITYARADGVQLSATLYLPPGYDKAKHGPLPFLFWAYPTEFRSAAAAAQVRGSPYRFTRPGGSSHLFALLEGYGVLDDPTMPIVAKDGKEPNDTYVEQLVSSAKAAVDKVVELGVADRNRIGVGGHSYGAFMTANLLAHSDLFKAGIARSGAYNRTLTPFGFQGEERTFWEAEELYTAMSPFNHADQVKAPILLVHGMADDNSGTFPVQSERFFAALKGNGKRVRYVQLPAEAHGYRARESVGHTLWEMVNWLDLNVKPAGRTLTP